jgi:hypothetical protein
MPLYPGVYASFKEKFPSFNDIISLQTGNVRIHVGAAENQKEE